DIANQLGVANILEGSVQKAADQVHINAQLIRASTDEHLWAESYDRKLDNIFGVESEVAAAVAQALKATLTGVEQNALAQRATQNPDAYQVYLRGIALWQDPRSMKEMSQAKESLEEAVRLDPNFAVAWATLVQMYSLRYFTGDATVQEQTAAQKALETAMRLQPELAEVQMAHAWYQ